MTGSARSLRRRWTLHSHQKLIKKGGGLGEEGRGIGPDRGAGGFIFNVFSVLFLGLVPDGVFHVFFSFYELLGSQEEAKSRHFLRKDTVFCEKVAPSFLLTIIAFWLDFEGLGPPGGLKNQKKQLPKNQRFFDVKKTTQSVYL